VSSLTVHLNRDGPRDLAVPDSFTARRPFDVVIENHGEGSHVHLRLDESLARVASLGASTTFVDGDRIERVRVRTTTVEEPVRGTLIVEAGYGAERREVPVEVAQYREDPEQVPVDESLADPGAAADDDGRGVDLETAGLAALSLLAIGVAGWAALSVDSPVVVAGAAAVVLAVVGVGAWSLR